MLRLRHTALAATLALAACGPHEPRADRVLTLTGDPARGRPLYEATCGGCHHVPSAWPWTLPFYGPNGFVSTLIDGVPRTRMPSFAGWSDQQLADVYAFIRTLK
jgi:mono/diheme cytochrome c family protein